MRKDQSTVGNNLRATRRIAQWTSIMAHTMLQPSIGRSRQVLSDKLGQGATKHMKDLLAPPSCRSCVPRAILTLAELPMIGDCIMSAEGVVPTARENSSWRL